MLIIDYTVTKGVFVVSSSFVVATFTIKAHEAVLNYVCSGKLGVKYCYELVCEMQ